MGEHRLHDHFGARPFDRREALGAGFTPHELDRGALARPYRGVRAVHPPGDPAARSRAYAVKLGDERAFAGLTAVALRGWPVPLRLRERTEIDVAGRTSQHRLRERGVRFSRIADARWRVDEVAGLRVLAPELVLIGLAHELTERELVTLVDAAITTSANYPDLVVRGATTLEQLAAAVREAGRVPGIVRMRRALDLARPGVESPMETVTRYLIHAAGLPAPEVQGVIVEHGVRLGRCDLVFRAARVAVEYEGEYHRDAEVFGNDLIRIRRLEAAGWRVIRISKRDLFPSHHAFIAQLRDALASRTTA